MNLNDRLDRIEQHIIYLNKRADTLSHDISIIKEVFTHIKQQFDDFKKEIETNK